MRDENSLQYDVCLSFAGEDRDYVRAVAEQLRQRGIRVFYDEYEQVQLWGKDLYTHLDDVYRNAARYCVLFVSEHYARKLWTNHERASAQARALSENQEYILPARLDDTDLPGLRPTVGYVDLRNLSPGDLVDLISRKIGDRPRENYFPPIPDRLYAELGSETREDRAVDYEAGYDIFRTLQRMSAEERELVGLFFWFACPAELPENVHINIDLLRRLCGSTPAKIKRALGGLRSLGIFCSLRDEGEDGPHAHLGTSELLVLEWNDMTAQGGNVTDVASAVIVGAMSGYCQEHGIDAIKRLDFAQLATATTSDSCE